MLWSWGDNSASQLGYAANGSEKPPRKSPTPLHVATAAFQANLIAVAAGDAHNCAMDELGGGEKRARVHACESGCDIAAHPLPCVRRSQSTSGEGRGRASVPSPT